MFGKFLKKLFEFFNFEGITYKGVLVTFLFIVGIVGFNTYLLDHFKGLPSGDLFTTFLWVNVNLLIIATLVYLSIRKLYKDWIQNRRSQLWKKLTVTFLSIFAVPFLFLTGVAIVGQSSFLRVFTDEQLKQVIEKLEQIQTVLEKSSLSQAQKERLKEELQSLQSSTQKLRQLVRHQKVVLTNYIFTFLVIAALVIFGAVVVSTYLAGIVSREFGNFSKALKAFARGNFNVRLGKDSYTAKNVREVEELITNFNLAVERTKNLYRELEQEKRLLNTVFEKVYTPIALFNKRNQKLFKANRAYETLLRFENLQELKKFVSDKENYHLEEIPLGGLSLVVVKDLTDFLYARRYKAWKEVASRLAHDIKNPLHTIQTSVEMVTEVFKRYLEAQKEGKNTEHLKEILLQEIPRTVDNVKKSVGYVVDLVDSFNNLSSEDETLKRSWFSLRSLLLELKKNFETNDFKVLIEVGPFYVYGDRQKLRRVFENLIRNSYEAIKSQTEQNTGGWIRFKTEGNLIHVVDSGPGIPAEKWSTVFLPFSSTKAKGRGLGLFIVKKFIDEHGWNIKLVPSREGEGAHFLIEVAPGDFKRSLK